jgi:RNA polymerase sigma-70 factor (ECF subfamily)
MFTGMLQKDVSETSKVVRLARKHMSDPEIVAGLVDRDEKAAAALYDKYCNKVNHLVWRLLGADTEHNDVVHSVFIHILTSIKNLKKPESLPDWITGIAVNTVRREIRNRKYRKILHLVSEYPEYAPEHALGGTEVPVKRVFGVLDEMSTDDHIVFVLRFVERNTLGEIASSCGYSLATAKRRVNKAREEFIKRARKDAILSGLIKEVDHVL